MTGWDLLEKLADKADNNPDQLEAPIWIAINGTYIQPNEVHYTKDNLSGNDGLFIKYEREDRACIRENL